MTIALGILAKDGVVIAADTEETLGDIIKYSTHKVRGSFRVMSKSGYPRWLLLAGSGHGHYVDAFSDALAGVVESDNQKIDTDPLAVLDEALERFYIRKVLPFARFPIAERPDFSVVIGLIAGGRSHLFVSDGATLRRAPHFAVVGAGHLIASPLLSAYVRHEGARSMSVREAAIVAAHAVYEAKAVTGVGGDTDVLAMFEKGKHARIVPPEFDALHKLFDHYSRTLRPAVLRSVVGRTPDDQVVAEIQRLREGLAKLIGNRFDAPTVDPFATPVKQPARKPPTRGRKRRTPSPE